MDGFLTVGQPAAVGAVHAMLATHAPHAVLLAGPPSVGKRSLALGWRSREQDRVWGVGCEHRVDGTDRGRLADGEEPVHA